MKSVLYLGCPAAERAETETLLAADSVSVVWADNVSYALERAAAARHAGAARSVARRRGAADARASCAPSAPPR